METSLLMFQTYAEVYHKESQYRNGIDFNSLCTYGVKCLDDAMLAIAKNELIVMGAGSGYGKTELALHISRTNALNGKKVAHYNLEGGSREAVQRMKWKDMCDLYFAEHKGEFFELDYRKWVLNKEPSSLLIELEAKVYNNLKDKIGENLYLYDHSGGLNCRNFCESLVKLEGLKADMSLDPQLRKHIGGIVNLDLIVIDHLHYFSLDKDEDEIREITEILKTVKIITEEMQIPVILVAHLRKLPRGHGVPDKEDVYGTSNICKIANTVIIISPEHEKDDPMNGLYPTYFRIAKSRQGLRPNVLISSIFDIHTRQYSKDYELYRCNAMGEVAGEPIPWNDRPRWAKTYEVKT